MSKTAQRNIEPLRSVALLSKDTVQPANSPTREFIVYSIPAYDLGKTPETLLGKEIKSQKYILSEQCVLFSKLNPRLPRVWKIDSPSENSISSTELLPLKPEKEKITLDFLYYTLTNPIFTARMKRYATGTSNSHQRVRPEQILAEQVFVPTIPDQNKITAVLSVLDKKIELLRKQNETLEEMARAIFHEWFVEFNFPDKDGKPYKASGEKMVDSELGEIPEGWHVGTLAELIDQLSERIGSDEQSKYAVMSAVNTGQLVPSSEYFTKQVFSKSISKYIKIQQEDFAYNPARINIGSIGRLREPILGAVSPVYVAFRAKKGTGAFVDFLIQTEKMKKHIELYANGSVRQTLGYDGFGAFSFAVPTESCLKEFDEITASLRNVFEQKEVQIENLRTTRDLLLPKLMSGEVRVNI